MFFFGGRLGIFQSVFCAVPGGGGLPGTCLFDCYISMELRNLRPLCYQGQVIKDHPLCELHMPAGFRRADVEYSGWGILAGFRKASGEKMS